jgi:hypothetical protein
MMFIFGYLYIHRFQKWKIGYAIFEALLQIHVFYPYCRQGGIPATPPIPPPAYSRLIWIRGVSPLVYIKIGILTIKVNTPIKFN